MSTPGRGVVNTANAIRLAVGSEVDWWMRRTRPEYVDGFNEVYTRWARYKDSTWWYTRSDWSVQRWSDAAIAEINEGENHVTAS